MPVSVSAKITGNKAWLRTLNKLSPKESKQIVVQSLLDCAHLVQQNAVEKQIIPGGPKGVVHPTRLTSRRGGSGLVGSIAVNRSPLPAAIEVGTHLVYGAIHELGLGPYPKRAFLAPAVEETEKHFPDVFMKNWRRVAGV